MQSPEESVMESHLSYPIASSSKEVTPPPTTQTRQLLKDRLYVGNLAPTVDEYSLLQVFSKFGKVSKLDFLFHKTGPQKGKPRGYAFIEYSDHNDAARALASANDKLLRGRKLVVTYAQQAPLDQSGSFAGKQKRLPNDTGKPTTLSLLKSVGSNRVSGTDDKIAKMEAKLRQLEQSSASGLGAGHPSLPPKPTAATLHASNNPAPAPRTNSSKRITSSLPSLPLAPASLPDKPSRTVTQSSHPPQPPLTKKGSSLAGVVLKKKKDP